MKELHSATGPISRVPPDKMTDKRSAGKYKIPTASERCAELHSVTMSVIGTASSRAMRAVLRLCMAVLNAREDNLTEGSGPHSRGQKSSRALGSPPYRCRRHIAQRPPNDSDSDPARCRRDR